MCVKNINLLKKIQITNWLSTSYEGHYIIYSIINVIPSTAKIIKSCDTYKGFEEKVAHTAIFWCNIDDIDNRNKVLI